MLFGGLSLPAILANAIALLIAITIHEFAHAWMATRLGDPTARLRGRLSLNPLVHLDALGTLMLLFAGIGWGKPVPVNPYNLRNGPKAGLALTSAAGPLSNLLLAALFSIPLRLGAIPIRGWNSSAFLPSPAYILFSIVLMNIALAIFNLIPLAPLDGFRVAVGLLPNPWAVKLARIETYGPLILLGLLLMGRVLSVNPLSALMSPFINLFLRLFLGI